jgi:beta-phosphoglucomutase-like phosphatase (HAD superfamily)
VKPLSKEHTQITRQALAEFGIERTPEQMETGRKKAYTKIRKEMLLLGRELPDDDAELFQLLYKEKEADLKDLIRIIRIVTLLQDVQGEA